MRKQVATILGNMAYEIKQCDCKDPALGLEIKQATLEICQKFPKTVDNPDGYEPKGEEEARPINCKMVCPKYDECYPFVNPILCTSKPNPDEGRLLTHKKEIGIVEACPFSDRLWYKHDHEIAKAQDAKTASIVRDEWRQKCEDLIATRHIVTGKEKDAECQERAEEAYNKGVLHERGSKNWGKERQR